MTICKYNANHHLLYMYYNTEALKGHRQRNNYLQCQLKILDKIRNITLFLRQICENNVNFLILLINIYLDMINNCHFIYKNLFEKHKNNTKGVRLYEKTGNVIILDDFVLL